jgi:hypothetical protein
LDFQSSEVSPSAFILDLINMEPKLILRRKSSTKLLIAIGFDSQEVECLDLDNIEAGWTVLTRLFKKSAVF